jgi:D-glycero-alpha-D-manno-heptose-7-phosphate kinase
VIVSRTPFRVSFLGGGSDLRAYYARRPGAVIAMAIGRYMYVTVNRRFDDTIRVAYTKTEIVEHVDHLQHDLIREALKLTGVTRGIEVTTIADAPAGIGLGSSSTLTVGVLNALHAFKGEYASPEQLAREACDIEIARLGHPIGKQDQYIAAYGGLHRFRFDADETVSVDPVVCPRQLRETLVGQLLLFYTGISRDAGGVLHDARRRIGTNGHTQKAMDALVDLVDVFHGQIAAHDLTRVGTLLHRGWVLKKRMSPGVSNQTLDGFYEAARTAGAVGGKIAGAGGGGCLLLWVPAKAQRQVRRVMTRLGLREIPLAYEPHGSRLVYLGG